MRIWTFASRTAKELLRDPLNIGFGLGFPLVLLLLLSAIQQNIPVPLFELQYLTPGITVFGLSFLSLFSATLIARDRETAFLQRLYTTPLKANEFIVGYILPFLPIALMQAAICYIAAVVLGLPVTGTILAAILWILPVSVLFIAIGLLCGSVLNVKQAGGLCGALLTNLTAWLSGVWFDLELVGGAFQKFANVLPFVHAVKLTQAVLAGEFSLIWSHFLWVAGYALVLLLAAILLFLRQMKNQ